MTVLVVQRPEVTLQSPEGTLAAEEAERVPVTAATASRDEKHKDGHRAEPEEDTR